MSYQHLMDESMVPVCSQKHAEKHQLKGNLNNLRQCTLLHDRQWPKINAFV
ncbi:hypothetical protein [Yersinia enterocolitica]|uniref:hypothetical protein n=1 Tax=Yersinia enterocolitica TaxID=630 RepID=UPI0021ADE1DC|nr:hypothetical protein [Yersinia enterocolitica]